MNPCRREFLLAMAAGPLAAGPELVVETHVHLFSGDLERFPGHPNAWKPAPSPLEEYLKFARHVGIAHAIHVSAEPYQDDLRYLEHTLEAAPQGFLKGTLLLDATLESTPARLKDYSRRHRGQIVALRVHCTRDRKSSATVDGPIRDRDLRHPNVRQAWQAAGESGIAIQAHIQPWFAPEVEKLASAFPSTRVILDHFGHAGVGGAVKRESGWTLTKAEWGYRDPKDFDQILRLARLPHVILKVSSLQYSSRQPHPHTDVRPLARKAFDAFGPDRMVWGSLGHTPDDFRQKAEVFDANFDFLSSGDRAKIRGLTAKQLFGF